MSSTRTYQCLSCRLRTAFQQVPRRAFQSSSSQQARRKKYPSIKASDLEEPHFQPYTAREKKLLALKYTPEQMKVIEAGEQAIDVKDMAKGRIRDDPMRIKYLDDFSKIRPGLDRDLTPAEASRVQAELRRARESGLAGTKDEMEDTNPHMVRLCQQTGLTETEINKLRIKNLVRHRVVNQTRMGKISSIYYLTIAGNGDGMVGVGEGKAMEFEDAERQALMNAVRNMKPIARYEDRTIYGDVQAKVGASIVKLQTRPPGRSSSSLTVRL